MFSARLAGFQAAATQVYLPNPILPVGAQFPTMPSAFPVHDLVTGRVEIPSSVKYGAVQGNRGVIVPTGPHGPQGPNERRPSRKPSPATPQEPTREKGK